MSGKIFFILFMQGIGPSSSGPLMVAQYPSMEACVAAKDYAEKNTAGNFYGGWFCSPIAVPDGAHLVNGNSTGAIR